jgi:glycosyltransferase involved in cell wall biosynthesis
MMAPYALPPSIPGGTRHYEMSLILEEYGWHSRVIASPFNHKTHQMDRPVSWRNRHLTQDEDGVEFTWVYTTPYEGNDLRRYINMASFLLTSQIRAQQGGRPDVVLGSSPHLLAALSGLITAKRYRVPFIFEVRDLWPESLVQLGLTNPVIIRPLQLLEEFLYARADAIVSLTEGIAADIQGRIKNPGKVHVLPNAVRKPTAITAEGRAEVRQRLGWRDDEAIAIYAGAHGDANDLGQVVTAARKLDGTDGVRFVLVGDGPTKAGLIADAAELTNLDFLDAVPKSEIVEILQSADIGMLTLKPLPLFEGARPNKLFDYMGAGLPTISTVKGEAEKVLTDSGAGIAVAPDGLADAVSRLSQDKAARARMSAAGFDHASNVQTREDIAREFAGILDQLTDSM